jgi:chaperonin GroEL
MRIAMKSEPMIFSLQNAASVSALILTTDAMVAELPKDEKAPAGMPGGMGDMDM